METVEVKVSELIGPALDWAVAKACHDGRVYVLGACVIYDEFVEQYGDVYPVDYSPSTDWSQCGPLIFKYHVSIEQNGKSDAIAFLPDTEIFDLSDGPTPLIAACRAIVAAKLGDTVQVPKELLQ